MDFLFELFGLILVAGFPYIKLGIILILAGVGIFVILSTLLMEELKREFDRLVAIKAEQLLEKIHGEETPEEPHDQ